MIIGRLGINIQNNGSCFRNNGEKAVEAEFIFPVDDNSAVYRFEAEIGNRTIVAECQPKSDVRFVPLLVVVCKPI